MNRDIIIEFIAIGNSVKVTAIDPISLREVSIVGSPTISKRELSNLAIKKLKYVLERDNAT